MLFPDLTTVFPTLTGPGGVPPQCPRRGTDRENTSECREQRTVLYFRLLFTSVVVVVVLPVDEGIVCVCDDSV